MSNRKHKLLTIGLIVAALAVGFWVRGLFAPDTAERDQSQVVHKETTMWTCSMHPQVRQPEPGLCPICAMELIPVQSDTQSETGPWQIRLSKNARKRAQIQTQPVQRKFVSRPIRMVGKVAYDETRLAYITAWIPGRIDRLYVDYTGIPVQKGDHMVDLYSPELITAQEELIQAVNNLEESAQVPVMQRVAQETVEAVREKLRLWGLTEKQIKEIEQQKEPTDHMTIYAPLSGVVIHKNALEGMYVETGTKIYTIADLSHLWVKLDAYESDLIWLRYGQKVAFYTEAYPGEKFEGTIVFIDPILDPQTRTVKIRVNVDNPEGKLKPDMFVRAQVHATLGADGTILGEDLAGSWICPMHPEIIKQEPGTCDICGMPLVGAESLSFIHAKQDDVKPPLVIPDSAPLITGTRAVVYVAVDGQDGLFEGREVKLGPRSEKYYVVKEGLEEGEQVVVKGNFKIDSAVQIQAKTSMMNPDDEMNIHKYQHDTPPEDGSAVRDTQQQQKFPDRFLEQLNPVYDAYFSLQTALSNDDLPAAKNAAGSFVKSIDAVASEMLDDASGSMWDTYRTNLQSTARAVSDAATIQIAREQFQALSDAMVLLVRDVGFVARDQMYLMQCPMAFNNRGADWLQNDTVVANPYFGSSMLRCGSQEAVFTGKSHTAH